MTIANNRTGKEPALNEFETELLKAGWAKNPNNIHGLPGSLWDGAGPNIQCLPDNHEAQILSDRIRVFTKKFFGEPYTRRSHWDTITVAVFDNTTDFLAWVGEVGQYKTALPAGANVWD